MTNLRNLTLLNDGTWVPGKQGMDFWPRGAAVMRFCMPDEVQASEKLALRLL
jgi:hypothetical protein